jgi:peptidoglycan/xylan/chitin deacetylase (PgdA/CDA1 family)
MPSLTLVNPRGTTQTVTEPGAFESYLRRGYQPQTGTVAAARQQFTGQPDVPAPLSAFDATYAPLGATPPALRVPPRRQVTKIGDLGTPGHGWAAGGSAASSNLNDTTTYARGTQSARVTSAGTGLVTSLRNTALTPMDLTGKRFECSVMVDDWTHVNALLIYLGDNNLANFRVLRLWDRSAASGKTPGANGEWLTFTVDLASQTSTGGTPNLAAVTAAQLSIQDDNTGNPVTLHLNHIGHFPGSSVYPNGVVSFAYDDSFLSQWTQAAPYLERYNFQGTFYTICDLVGADPYYMTLAQLRAMQDVGGHEIGAHAYTAAAHNTVGGFTGLTAAALDAELRLLKNWLVGNGFQGRDHLAYPQGFFNASVETIVRRYFTSARSTLPMPVETWNPANLTRLRHGVGANTPTTVAAAKAVVDTAYANGSWLIITTHDLVTVAPTPAGTTLVQWDIASYQQLVDYVATKGIPVRTVGDVLATAR